MSAICDIADVGAVDPGRPLYGFEIRALKVAHRRVPVGEGGGECRWCGTVLLGKRGKFIGKPDPNRSWCRDSDGRSECLRAFNLHTRSNVQFAWLERHRGLVCAGCGAQDPQRWQRGQPTTSSRPTWTNANWAQQYWSADDLRDVPRSFDPLTGATLDPEAWMLRGGQCSIERVSDLQVDHVVPLWKVALTVALADRRPFFGPDNLQLLCTPCHKAKSKAEAAERSALKRQRCAA